MRPVSGGMPTVWDGQGDHSLTQLWVRDNPPRPLDFASLTALADVFFPRVFVRRATLVPVGTVTRLAAVWRNWLGVFQSKR